MVGRPPPPPRAVLRHRPGLSASQAHIHVPVPHDPAQMGPETRVPYRRTGDCNQDAGHPVKTLGGPFSSPSPRGLPPGAPSPLGAPGGGLPTIRALPGLQRGARGRRKGKGPPAAPACRPRLAPGGLRTSRSGAAAPTHRAHSLHNSAPTRPHAALQPTRSVALHPPRRDHRGSVVASSSGSSGTHILSREGRLWGLCATISVPFLLGNDWYRDCKGVVSRTFHQSFLLEAQGPLTRDPQGEGLVSSLPFSMSALKVLLSTHVFNA